MPLKGHNEFNDVTGSCDLQILLGAVCLSIQILAGFSEADLHYRDNKSWCDMEIFKILKYGVNLYILMSTLMCHLCPHSAL